jgi:hypothetical protein
MAMGLASGGSLQAGLPQCPFAKGPTCPLSTKRLSRVWMSRKQPGDDSGHAVMLCASSLVRLRSAFSVEMMTTRPSACRWSISGVERKADIRLAVTGARASEGALARPLLEGLPCRGRLIRPHLERSDRPPRP